jgi:dolichol-phosphate mannosyltransferase
VETFNENLSMKYFFKERSLLHIIIPVFNEADNIGSVYSEIRSKINASNRILIVYDFDGDNTLPVVRKLQKKDPRLELVQNIYGGGVLNALKSGFSRVPAGPCLVVMGDLSDDLSVVDLMLEKYRQGFKVVCGSRYMKGGYQEGGPLLKRTLSRLAGLSLNFFGFPVHDITNNFRLYDKSFLEKITIESRGGFELAMEITVKAVKMGYPVCEISASWQDRKKGKSHFRLWKWLPHYLRWYLYALWPGRRP